MNFLNCQLPTKAGVSRSGDRIGKPTSTVAVHRLATNSVRIGYVPVMVKPERTTASRGVSQLVRAVPAPLVCACLKA